MSANLPRWLIVSALVLVLAGANATVMRHEKTLAEGEAMFLELAPVDPRSIMQGDYMALRFAIGNALPKEAPPHGRMVVRLDERKVGTFVRVHQGEALAAGEKLLEYRVRKRNPRIITDAYHFQEGQAKVFERAKYGEVRAREDGVALLVRLADEKLGPLEVAPAGRP
jgi:uncharacterized membrane-anchored protein